MAIKPIGPSFPTEIRLAGLAGLPFAWGEDGAFQFDSRMTQAQIDAVLAVYAAHDPTKPAPLPPLAVALDAVLSATAPTAAQLKAVFQIMRDQLRPRSS